MRLWTLHPGYLDAIGLVALWREGLLAQHVLAGKTRGYRNHPQLDRFKATPDPLRAIGFYLTAVLKEAEKRGYHFDGKKILKTPRTHTPIRVSRGQVRYEWESFYRRGKKRSPSYFKNKSPKDSVRVHPLFSVKPGPIESWERVKPSKKRPPVDSN